MLTHGNKFIDCRGKVLFNNELNLYEVKRMYVLENKDINIIRAWQAHKVEKRWFVAVEGQFEIKLVKIDNFDNPSIDLRVQAFQINSDTMDCLEIQAGYATSIRSLSNPAKLVVFSNYLFGEVDDFYKFDLKTWK